VSASEFLAVWGVVGLSIAVLGVLYALAGVVGRWLDK
jgi:hypothetical protein